MLTRCPSCATHFRVTTDQLKLRAGRVRCGECQHVFNALDTLIEEAPVIIAPVPSNPPDPIADPWGNDTVVAEPLDYPDMEAVVPSTDVAAQAHEGEPEPSGDDATPPQALAPAPPETVPEEASFAPADRNETVDALPPDAPTRDETTSGHHEYDAPTWTESDVEPPPPRRWPWAIGGVLALLALALQAIFTFRVELAVLLPESRPLLASICESLDCSVGLPSKVALVGIEASDLHPDAAHKGRLTLSATLKNRAPFAQQYPHLELTLTDTADKAIVRKVLSPEQYLPRGMVLAHGMASNADLALAVTLDAGELPASGYRLYIFYP